MQTPVLTPPALRGRAARTSWLARRTEADGILPSCACPAQYGGEGEEGEQGDEGGEGEGGEEYGQGGEGGEEGGEGGEGY